MFRLKILICPTIRYFLLNHALSKVNIPFQNINSTNAYFSNFTYSLWNNYKQKHMVRLLNLFYFVMQTKLP